ncbi:MAG: hypothetical protein PF795_15070 [Kiritimatiellae bacterium]|jgi:hypothetical protein|nr:hypothetical protein [Kiritimatiellia bacterium]
MSNSSHQDVGERRAEQQAGRPLSAVFIAVAAFYVAAALMNGRFLHEEASKREFGKVRDIWMAVTRPLSDISTRLHLDTIRGGAEQLRKE